MESMIKELTVKIKNEMQSSTSPKNRNSLTFNGEDAFGSQRRQAETIKTQETSRGKEVEFMKIE